MRQVKATIRQGYRIASGNALPGTDQRFNEDGGTIRLQIPEFKKQGCDLDLYFGGPVDTAYFAGTLGCDVAPYTVAIKRPEIFLDKIRWTNKFDDVLPQFRESFFLSPAQIEFDLISFKALLYIPDPRTKPGHFQASSIVEVIAVPIPGITYGSSATLFYNENAIELVQGEQRAFGPQMRDS